MDNHDKFCAEHIRINSENKIGEIAKEIHSYKDDFAKTVEILKKHFLAKLNYKDGKENFKGLSEPLIEHLNKYYHPHAKIIIDTDSAEILEGIKAFQI